MEHQDKNILRQVHLLRHGETNWNRERRAQGQQESVLTELGIEQAQALSDRLSGLPIDEVYSSSSLRARQTAGIVFGSRGIPITHCEQLREIYMGPWEGRLYSELRAENPEQFHAFWRQPDQFSLPGAETFADLQQRAILRLQGILDSSESRQIAIVSHGALIKTILCTAEPRPLSQLWQPPALHNCSHSVIDILPGGEQRISLYSDQPYSLTHEQ